MSRQVDPGLNEPPEPDHTVRDQPPRGRAGGTRGVEAVLAGLEARGVSVVRDATDYLRRRRLAALYITVAGAPGILLVGVHTQYGDALHEARHFGQDRRAGHPGEFSRLAAVLGELDAYGYELRNARRWRYSNAGLRHLRRQIRRYNRLLDDLVAELRQGEVV